jgi:phosphatidylglycerophosphate synthase
VLAAGFFVLLSFYQYARRGDALLLSCAFFIYVVALVSDYLDGYLARKWHVEGAFGRIADPFADKILVLGSFIFFAGKNFVIPQTVASDQAHHVVRTISGVVPWMVIVILARELLVTTLRGFSEASGQSFGAVWAGKFKMGFQSGTILAILAYVAFHHQLLDGGYELPARIVRDFGIWGTIVITVYSSFSYIGRAMSLFRQPTKGSLERVSSGSVVGHH